MKTDIACTGSALWHLRTSLSRYLREFQADLEAIEHEGLHPNICDDVKEFLRQSILEFENHASPISVYDELAKHFRAYSKVYADWNGHEGADSGKAANRRKEMSKLSERRGKLFRKLSQRQADLASTKQFNLDFVINVRTPLNTLANKYPEIFPRLRQASLCWG